MHTYSGSTESFDVQWTPYARDPERGLQTHTLVLPSELADVVGFQQSINTDNVGYNVLIRNSNSIASTVGEIEGILAETFAPLHAEHSDDWAWGKDLRDPSTRSDPWFSGGEDDLQDPDLHGTVVQGPDGQKAVMIYGDDGQVSRIFIAGGDGTVRQHVYLAYSGFEHAHVILGGESFVA